MKMGKKINAKNNVIYLIFICTTKQQHQHEYNESAPNTTHQMVFVADFSNHPLWLLLQCFSNLLLFFGNLHRMDVNLNGKRCGYRLNRCMQMSIESIGVQCHRKKKQQTTTTTTNQQPLNTAILMNGIANKNMCWNIIEMESNTCSRAAMAFSVVLFPSLILTHLLIKIMFTVPHFISFTLARR